MRTSCINGQVGGFGCRRARAGGLARRTPRTRPRTPMGSARCSSDSDVEPRLRTAGIQWAATPRPRGSSAACGRSEGRTPPNRRGSVVVPPGSSSASASPSLRTVVRRGRDNAGTAAAKRPPFLGIFARLGSALADSVLCQRARWRTRAPRPRSGLSARADEWRGAGGTGRFPQRQQGGSPSISQRPGSALADSGLAQSFAGVITQAPRPRSGRL